VGDNPDQAAAFEEGRPTDPGAWRSLAEVLGVDLDRIDRLAALAWRLYQGRQYREAVSVFRGLMALDPENVDLYRGYAISIAKTGDLVAALESLDNALLLLEDRADRDADRAQLLALMASFLFKAGRKAQAVAVAERAINLSPDDAPWLPKLQRGLERARKSLAKKRIASREEHLQGMIEPRLDLVARGGASLAWALGYQDRELISLFENGMHLLESGHPDRAKRIFVALVTLDDAVPVFHVALASAHEQLGDGKRARRYYDEAVRRARGVRDGEDILADVLLRRAHFHSRRGRADRARQDLDELLMLPHMLIPEELRAQATTFREGMSREEVTTPARPRPRQASR
jgi:tetratricopeptide (TPR) repeat protein